ncbi:MAG: RNA polymerase sigma factor [Gammaproteobacteria bacterium]|nr:RNA polymerase sigma factor [Gammaproteobacteria bacterium]
MPVKASEIKLISRIASGEEAAFEQLFHTTCEAVYRYLKRLTGDSDRSDKLLTKTYKQAWQSASNYDQKLAPASWLLQLARNAVLSDSGLRKRADTPEKTSAVNIVALDRQKVFIKAMDSLPVESRDSLVLVLMHVFTYHAISEIMGLTIDEVKTRVFESKNLLKEKLRQHGIKKHEVSKSNILRELIPLYINGALAGKHKIAFEKSLKNDPNLKQEYMEFYEIEAYFDQLDPVSKQHLDRMYSTIKNSLDDLQEHPEAAVDEEQTAGTKIDFIHELLSSPRIGWGLAVLQFAILAIVLIFVAPDYSNSVEANIAAAQILQQQHKSKKLNVIFQDSATNQQIRDLLLALQAEVYSGPTDIGLYTITIEGNEQRAQEVLSTLRNSGVVVLADLAY